MLQFIPFEDDWSALERLRPEELIPYRVGLLAQPTLPATPAATLAVQGNRPDAGPQGVPMLA